MIRSLQYKYSTYLGITIALLIMLSKFFILDIDIPKFEIAFYSPFDELFYVRYAYNQFFYNELFFDSSPSILLRPVITNLASYIGLIFFGDTYQGLRFGSLLLGVISLLLFWKILLKTTQNIKLIVILPMFLAINFNFSLANIVVEPTMARTAMMLLSLWILIRTNQLKDITLKHSFIVGFTICLLFLITYPTNFFILPASLLSFGVILYKRKPENEELTTIIKPLTIFVIGYFLAFITVLSIHQFIGGDIFETASRSGNYSARVSFQLSQLINNFIGIANANFIRFNSLLSIIFLISVSIFAYSLKNKKIPNIPAATFGIFLFLFILQTVFINDYAQRKLVILLPLILLFIASQMELILEKKLSGGKILVIFAVILFPILIILFQYKIYPKQLLNSPVIFVSHTATAIWMIFAIIGLRFNKFKKAAATFGFLLLFIPELYLSHHYFIQNRTYHYKKALISLNQYNNRQFTGGMSIGYQLYNKIECKINPYAYYNKTSEYQERIKEAADENSGDSYSIGYCKDLEFYENLGFQPVKTLMPKEKTVREFDVILYKYQK